VLVGMPLSQYFHVFELQYRLPRFAMYVPVTGYVKEPSGSVVFRVNERANRISMWLSNAFNVDPKKATSSLSGKFFMDEMDPQKFLNAANTSLDMKFVSLRNGTLLSLTVKQDAGNVITVNVDSMDVAGDILQDLTTFLNITELESVIDFTAEFEEFKRVLLKVDEFNATRLKLTAEMADSSQLLKALVIKAEDARILSNMKQMKKMYSQLAQVNRELIGEYIKRANNHNELLVALKDVNAMIQRAAKLRVGPPSARVIQECRASMKANNVHSLFKIIKLGHAASGPL